MIKTSHITRKTMAAALMSFCLLFMFGCKKDTIHQEQAPERRMLLMMNTDDRTYAEAQASENNIVEISAYAFDHDSGELLGKSYVSTAEPSFAADCSFLMDIKVTSTDKQTVDIYAIANASQIGFSESDALVIPENPTRGQLEGLSFISLAERTRRRGLPMSCITTVELDVSDNNAPAELPSTAVNKDEHNGHYALSQNVSLQFKRCVSKIEVYAAKLANEAAGLKVYSVTLNNHKQRAYVFPQTNLPSEGKDNGTILFSLTDGMTIDAALESDSDANRQNPSSYNEVMSTPYYIFESVGGTTDWSAPDASGEGAYIEVSYQFEDSGRRTSKAYLPKIERNGNYRIFCLINNKGAISIEYNVQPWDEVVWDDLNFVYPTSTNPVKYDGLDENNMQDPTIYYDPEQKKDSYVDFIFELTAPAGLLFTPVLNASTEDYQIKVFRNGMELNSTEEYVASADPYTIRIIALKDVQTEKVVEFAITYTEFWTNQVTPLFINGEEGKSYYPGSESIEYINIKHIPVSVASADPVPDTDTPVQP